jgi:hypothetical protein
VRELFILFIGIALLGLSDYLIQPAWAATLGFSNCRGTAIAPPTMRKAGEQACYEYDDATDSGGFIVVTPTALLCLDPDIAAAGTATATVIPRRCHIGYKPSSNPTFQCEATVDGTGLDGTPGAEGTQNMCVRVSTGAYYFDVAAGGTGGKDAVMTITAE